MPSEAVQQVLEQGQRSGLFSSAEAQEVIAQLTADQPITAELFSARLVEKKILTAYQAEQLLAGRGDECLIAERYGILEKLGAGGMGTVYKAQDTKLGRLVALKVLPSHLVKDAAAIARFQREAKALAKVSHPAIVQAHDMGEDRGQHFLVMEYVEGTNLDRVIKEQGRLPPTVAADYIHQATLGLQHAHQKGLVHRDLKPSNLLLAPARRIKILDLGLARFVQDQVADPQLTREGTGLGTPDYMAPEQFGDARHVDHRADIYALGCTLYHLLTGRVAFPGTSLSEKARAHETEEPEPLEALCPDIPAGLILVVQRMMAKKPDDRFASASELAEALAPYVSGSSASLPEIKKTTSWHGSQLSFTVPRRGRRRAVRVAVAGGVPLALIVVLSLLVPGLLRKEETPAPEKQASAHLPPKQAEQKDPPQEPPEPNVLTVSKDAKDGGQFQTIGAALEKVKPGQTIRVLDGAVYRESLALTSKSKHARVTLEAPHQATIEPTQAQGVAVNIAGVPHVTVRGFRFQANAPKLTMVRVTGPVPGLTLEWLDMTAGSASDYDGISLVHLDHSGEDAPVVVQNCVFRRMQLGINIIGSGSGYPTTLPCARISIRNNTFSDPVFFGVVLRGLVRQVQVVGNRFHGTATMATLQLENLSPQAEDVLIANNTFFECAPAFRVWAGAIQGKAIEVRNNLVLGSGPQDMLFLDSGGSIADLRGPGEGTLVSKTWQFSHNWREVNEPVKSDLAKPWIPPSKADVMRKQIPVLSREPNHPEFLRPAKDSPLASEGVGKSDPRLPMYVGAVAPEGVSSWDWNRTWRMPKDAQLLMVSKDPKDGGQFRTINDALKEAKPWATVRVLDDGLYAESLAIDNPVAHEGIALEAPKRATILASKGVFRALQIKGVPGVRVKGFRFRESGASRDCNFISVGSRTPGLLLEGLDFSASGGLYGIFLANINLAPNEEPVIVRDCNIQVGFDGIVVIGPNTIGPGIAPASGLSVRDNRVWKARRGILLMGNLTRVHVTGNVVTKCEQAALQIENLTEGSQEILIANNTAYESDTVLRIWNNASHDDPVRGRVEIRNNLFFDGNRADMSFVVMPKGESGPGLGDHKSLMNRWRFQNNRRDVVGNITVLPLSPDDQKLETVDLISRDAATADFLRPEAKSSLATGGAGKKDPTLPVFVGAVPPKGMPAWDWDKTWRWRARASEPAASKTGSDTAAAGDKGDPKK